MLDSALADFPVIGPQLQDNVHSLHGNALALAIGIGGRALGRHRRCLALEHALDRVWGVPPIRRASFVRARLRAWLARRARRRHGLRRARGRAEHVDRLLRRIGADSRGGVSLIVSFTVFLTAFRVLTSANPRWRDVLPGAIAAAIAWELLLTVGGYYVAHELRHTSRTYGVFALVIVLLSWLYLAAT